MEILPTEYRGHRFIATPELERGERLRLLVDTAGSLFLFEDVAERHGLDSFRISREEGEPQFAARIPEFTGGRGIPMPPEWEGSIIPLRPKSGRAKITSVLDDPIDGVLGQQSFGGRIWEFDYPEQELRYTEPDDPLHERLERYGGEGKTALSFRYDRSGNRLFNFARVVVLIGGEPCSMLLDTGASCQLSETAFEQLGLEGERKRATSFLGAERFGNLHEEHPDWQFIEDADVGLEGEQPVMKVPEVQVAGVGSGPVTLVWRPDDNFRDYMSQWTDRPVEGALGGDFLHKFRVTIDYPAAALILERPE